jgi:hypothetical protein
MQGDSQLMGLVAQFEPALVFEVYQVAGLNEGPGKPVYARNGEA